MIFGAIIWISYLISLYVVIFWLYYFFENKSRIDKENRKRTCVSCYPSVTVAVPAHNEENSIKQVIQSILDLDYPKNKIELMVINDGSTDDTQSIVEQAISKNPKRNIQLINKKQGGKGQALNLALEKSKGEFFVCLDADSFVDKSALKHMIGLYCSSTDNLAIVTPILKVDSPKNWLQRLQRFEYTTAMFIVRLMSFLDCNYIAPGPFTVYRKEIIQKLGGFDEKSLVEDQEIAYRVQLHHYKITQCPGAYVKTLAPNKLKEFYRQRNRWFKGTLMNLIKYRKLMLNRSYGDFGMFQMPINLAAYALAVSAVFFFIYYTIWPIIKWIKELYLVGFDFWPYLRSLHFSFNILDVDLGKMTILYVILFLSLVTFFLAHSLNKESIQKINIIYIIPFFFIYFLFLSFVSVIVIVESGLGKIQRW